MSTAKAIRWKSEERDWVQSCAEFEGVSFSEFVREAVFEKIEGMADIEAYNEALRDDDGTRYTMDEVRDMVFG